MKEMLFFGSPGPHIGADRAHIGVNWATLGLKKPPQLKVMLMEEPNRPDVASH